MMPLFKKLKQAAKFLSVRIVPIFGDYFFAGETGSFFEVRRPVGLLWCNVFF
jgi:hypothetical protein